MEEAFPIEVVHIHNPFLRGHPDEDSYAFWDSGKAYYAAEDNTLYVNNEVVDIEGLLAAIQFGMDLAHQGYSSLDIKESMCHSCDIDKLNT